MAEALYDLLRPSLSPSTTTSDFSSTVSEYLDRLSSLSLASLTTTEPESLNQSANSNALSIRALASRSAKSTVTSAEQLSALSDVLPTITTSVTQLRDAIPALDEQAVNFSTAYSKSRDENVVLDRRKNAMLVSRQIDKVAEILELPSLLSTAIASASSGTGSATSYSQALDLHAHVRRLQILYTDSDLIKSVVGTADEAMKDMTRNLVLSLRSPNIRLAAAIRTIGLLRRVAPELAGPATKQSPKEPATWSSSFPTQSDNSSEGHYGALFLTARLFNLLTTLDALSPLRDLADQETARRMSSEKSTNTNTTSSDPSRRTSTNTNTASNGQQTERYLKRYIEIFREQSFTTISTFRNIFPEAAPSGEDGNPTNSTQQPTSALTTFPLHLVTMLMDVLRTYLPNVTDSQARESLLMQVLYAANSLGRLGADFSLIIALLEEEHDLPDEDDNEVGPPPAELKDDNYVNTNADFWNGPPHKQTNGTTDVHENTDDQVGGSESEEPGPRANTHLPVPDSNSTMTKPQPEWLRVMEKHRVQAARLETLSTGGGARSSSSGG